MSLAIYVHFANIQYCIQNIRRLKKVKTFQCEECEHEFTNQNDLSEHVKAAHSDVKAFQCDECECAFRTQMVLKGVEKHAHEQFGVRIGWETICNHGYADDLAIMEESKKKLQLFLDIFNKDSNEDGLKMNIKKAKFMVITKETPSTNQFTSIMKNWRDIKVQVSRLRDTKGRQWH